MKPPILLNYNNQEEVFDDFKLSSLQREGMDIVVAVKEWGDGESFDYECADVIFYLNSKLYVSKSYSPRIWNPIAGTLNEILSDNDLLLITQKYIREYFKSFIVFI